MPANESRLNIRTSTKSNRKLRVAHAGRVELKQRNEKNDANATQRAPTVNLFIAKFIIANEFMYVSRASVDIRFKK